MLKMGLPVEGLGTGQMKGGEREREEESVDAALIRLEPSFSVDQRPEKPLFGPEEVACSTQGKRKIENYKRAEREHENEEEEGSKKYRESGGIK